MPKRKPQFLRRVLEFDYLALNEYEVPGLPNRLQLTTLGTQHLDRGMAEMLGTRLLEWANREPEAT